MSKVIFLDVDGTLTNYENIIPESAKLAVQKARKNGHLVYLCTGRSRAEIYDEIWEIGFDGLIGGNGSYVESHGHIIMHQLISKQQCQHIVDWLHKRGLEFYLESNNGLFASEHFETKAESAIREYATRKGKMSEHLTVRQAFPEMIFGAPLIRDDLNKVSFLLNSYQDHLDSIEEFPDLVAHTWGGANETALFGDLGVKDVSKAHAIDVLLAYLNKERKDTFAFGDASIDIPMLKYCEVGISVASGSEETKKIADYVTDGVDEDGLYKAFVHFQLIEGEECENRLSRTL